MSVMSGDVALVSALEHLTAAIERLAKSNEDLVTSGMFKPATQAPSRPSAPQQPVVPPRFQMDWKPFKDKPGHWIFSNTNQLLKDQLLQAPNKTVEQDGWKYRLSGENDIFIQRFPGTHALSSMRHGMAVNAEEGD